MRDDLFPATAGAKVLEAAATIFEAEDIDQNGMIDKTELMAVVRKLSAKLEKPFSHDEVSVRVEVEVRARVFVSVFGTRRCMMRCREDLAEGWSERHRGGEAKGLDGVGLRAWGWGAKGMGVGGREAGRQL